ncbi:MAG: metallopeptidase TldD-related protein, partial [Candidatus Methylomirabilales bacterium]
MGRVLGSLLGKPVDYGDLYFEYRVAEAFALEEGQVKKATRNITQGVGVRATAEEKTGYAFSDEITVERLELAARTARAIAERAEGTGPVPVARPGGRPHSLYPVARPPTEATLPDKLALLEQVDRVARSVDPRITQVMASFTAEQKIVLVATAEGLAVGDVQPLTRLQITCIAEAKGQRQTGTYGGGGRVEFGFFSEGERFARFAREAARQALLNLEAVEAPAGTFTVVLGPGWPGILLHEAVGHGLEADFNRKGTSAFTGRIGERVASPLCTVVDDGTLPGRRGSLNVDDEGTPTSRTVLIENGILRGYLQDRLNAALLKMPLTGNGRRESYAHIPMPRMTNTFMLPGGAAPEE